MSENRICRISKQPFVISDKEIEICKRMNVPPPTVSPTERLRQLMAFRNEWKLYRRKCDATGKEIISAYPPDSHFTIYNNETWWGDSWDATSYGRDFDFNCPFFEQFADLQREVPREGTTIFNCENCDFNSHIRKSKNCYLNSLMVNCEDVYYSYWMAGDKDCYDCLYTNESTLCYESNEANRCYNCAVIQESNDCTDCFFSYQLQGCQNCLFCTNLVRKSFHIFNKPVSKEEFRAFKEKIFNGSWASWQKANADFLELKKNAEHRCVHTLKCENCTGDHIYNSKNCLNCFDAHEAEDCENTVSLGDAKDIFSCYSAGWPRCEVVYNSVVSRGSMDIAFCNYTYYCTAMRYCDSCSSCKNCFGCVGLKHKEYCILNKQYSKSEYEELLPRIIEHMGEPRASAQRERETERESGFASLSEVELYKKEHMKKTREYGEFFLSSHSPYAFNETAAMDFFPLEKTEALKRGYRWREEEKSEIKPVTLLSLPDSINETGDDVNKEILGCIFCGKNYRIIPQELKFYQVQQIPLPRECPQCRHKRRMKMRNPIQLWERFCSKCGQSMQTSYAPDRPETVICEKCYSQTVF